MPVRGRPKAEVILDEAEKTQFSSIAASRMSAALVVHARIVLAVVKRYSNHASADRHGLIQATVGKWRARFPRHRVPGLYDELRSGRPCSIDDERVTRLIRKTLGKKPKDGSTYWSVRSAGAENKIFKSSAHRYFQLFVVKPYLSKNFKFSANP